MKLNNTQEKRKIIRKNVPLKEVIAGGLVIFSLAAVVFSANQMKSEILDSEEYGFYSTHYIENLHNINPADYDSKFGEIYENVSYSYDGKTYSGLAIYIISYDDGSVHLVDSNNRAHDLLTNEELTAKRKHVVPFKESSIFYELYESGIIQDENVQLSSSYSDMISRWDGKKHYKTVDLVAERETSAEYQKKYGGK